MAVNSLTITGTLLGRAGLRYPPDPQPGLAHKNDNRFVEQKNSSLIRAYLGHDRLDTVEQTTLLNRLQLRRDIYALLDRLFALPNALPDEPSQER
nr:hypothetical protein [Anaerolineae bacterium]